MHTLEHPPTGAPRSQAGCPIPSVGWRLAFTVHSVVYGAQGRGLGFTAHDLSCRLQSLGIQAQGSGCKVVGFRTEVLGFMLHGSGVLV